MASRSTDAERRRTRTSDEEDASKRSRARVSRACTRCRARKDKCDAKQPECTNCINAGQPCLYVAGNKKRGLPEGYVRGLEKLWAVMLQKVDGLDDTVRRVVNQNEEELLQIWNHQKIGDDLHTAWKESNVLADLEKLLSRLEHGPTIHQKRKRDCEDDNEAAQPLSDTRNDRAVLAPDFKVIETSGSNEPVSSLNIRDLGPGFGEPLLQNRPSTTNPEEVPLPFSAAGLLDQYFTFTHCWFPILDRPSTLRKFYEHTRLQKGHRLDTADLACMWAVCAYTHQQTGHLWSAPDAIPGQTVTEMRSLARKMIPSESGPFSIGHVQALLLLVLLDIGIGDWTSAWMLVGSAIRALLISMEPESVLSKNLIGPYSDSGATGHEGTSASGHEAPRRKEKGWQAVLQGCFILDTLLAVCVKRPSHLRSGHLDPTQLLEEDGHEEWEPWKAAAGNDGAESREPAFVISCFNRLTELCMVASDAFCTKASQMTSGMPISQHVTSSLGSLSGEYPFTVSDVIRRPPHQMILQACHFAIQTISSQSNVGVQPGLKWKFIENLELFEHSWNLFDKCGVPSMLIPLCHLINAQTNTASSSLGSHDLWQERLDQIRSRLSLIWPGAKSFNDGGMRISSKGRYDGAPVLPSNSTLQTPPTYTNFAPVPSIRRNQGAVGAGAREPILFQYQDIPQYAGVLEESQPNEATSVDYSAMSIDLPEENYEASVGPNFTTKKANISGLATSPSFNGDEIDALFHEMAQLDTTQWTVDRTQGLKDFGFADDTTFEAFCNDPDRLMLSDGYMGPVFNNHNNMAPGGQATISSNDGTRIGKMTFDDIFR
ncbi:Fungal Zn2-Cys6 binuclear cluster domain-containing protein [Cladophialophora immunda]|nr:Fungal Zn2-Cys6 binuclear cluster domain-containing protein [Cladophialophora immunda]